MDDATEAVSAPRDGTEELAYRLRQTQLITQFGRFAFETHDVNIVLQEACRVSALGLQSELAKIMRYLPDEGQFLICAGVGWKPGVVGHARIPGGLESPAGYAFETAKPVISNHLSNDTRFRTPQVLIEHDAERAINVIIRGGQNCYGVLEVDSRDGNRFGEADGDFLQGFANLLGVAIERHDVEKRLRQAVKDQEFLTQEISHRVKNSLAIVASLLTMQRRLSDDADVRRTLADAEARVQTIAQVHDRLWRNNEVTTIDLAGFMAELCGRFAEIGPNHDIHCDVPKVAMAADRAVTLGLLANELVTNAIKYAYPDSAGRVDVSLKTTNSDMLRFEVYDEGIGMPKDTDPAGLKSLGMRLIDSLVRQLGGHIEWQDAKPGTRFILEFPRQGLIADVD